MAIKIRMIFFRQEVILLFKLFGNAIRLMVSTTGDFEGAAVGVMEALSTAQDINSNASDAISESSSKNLFEYAKVLDEGNEGIVEKKMV